MVEYSTVVSFVVVCIFCVLCILLNAVDIVVCWRTLSGVCPTCKPQSHKKGGSEYLRITLTASICYLHNSISKFWSNLFTTRPREERENKSPEIPGTFQEGQSSANGPSMLARSIWCCYPMLSNGPPIDARSIWCCYPSWSLAKSSERTFSILYVSKFHLMMLSSCCVVKIFSLHETGSERTIELAVLLKLSTLDCVTDSSNLQKKVLFHLRYRSHMEHIPQLCRIPKKVLLYLGYRSHMELHLFISASKHHHCWLKEQIFFLGFLF